MRLGLLSAFFFAGPVLGTFVPPWLSPGPDAFQMPLFENLALGTPTPTWPITGADGFQKFQYPISKAGMLANIGSNGAKGQGAHRGVVIASPTKDNPNYLYTWIRDSALVYKFLVDQYISGRDDSLLDGIHDWIASQMRLQQVTNPSGTVESGGLGEPKFNIDETEYTESWGRPQRDGPALRARTFITFANYQLTRNETFVQRIWPAIRLDLDYVTLFWNSTGYDLWEETLGSSFFTLAASHRALRQGAALAKELGHNGLAEKYTEQAVNVLCFLQSFWDSSKSYIISNININTVGYSRSGLDVNSILASVHQFDPEAGCDSDTFQPCSDRALRNHKAVVDSFRSIYAINSGHSPNEGAAIGRYPEDVYFGGNPWYLATFAAAEQLYYAIHTWLKLGEIEVTPLSLPFFQPLYPLVQVGTYPTNSTDGFAILLTIRNYADQFVLLNKRYLGPDGGLGEQFDRNTGAPKSAADLTWSYASAVSAFDARLFNLPGPWGAKGLKAPTGRCQTPIIPKIPVTFNLVSDSDNAYVVGELSELGGWDPSRAVQLRGTKPNWSVTVQLPIARMFECKFIRKYPDGGIQWESGPNLRHTSNYTDDIHPASTDPDSKSQATLFNLLTRIILKVQPVHAFEPVPDLASEECPRLDMRSSAVGLLRRLVVWAFSEDPPTKDDPFASRLLLDEYESVLLQSPVLEKDREDSKLVDRLVEILGFFYVLLARDENNLLMEFRTGVRYAEAIRELKDKLVNPLELKRLTVEMEATMDDTSLFFSARSISVSLGRIEEIISGLNTR